MPRIDPIQLLNCLSVLLSPNGGIKSTEEVQRLANLMSKFSKKLVSKCIYIQILKCTETELLGLFMGSGGWRLVHTWLTESICAKNWPLIKELLELLLLCPVDIEQLKTNNCPKLIKELSKEGNHFAIRALAAKLVEQWLKTVKGETVIPVSHSELPQIIAESQLETKTEGLIKLEHNDVNNADSKPVKGLIKLEPNDVNHADSKPVSDALTPVVDTTSKENDLKLVTDEKISKIKDEVDTVVDTLPVLKISVQDGKQVISEVDDSHSNKEKLKDHRKNKDRSHERSSSKSSSSKHSSKTHSSSSSDKKSSSKSSSSSTSRRHSSKDRSKDKDKHSSHSSSKSKHDSGKSSSDRHSSSSRSKEEKSKYDKDKSDKDKSDKDKSDKDKSDKDKSDKDKSDKDKSDKDKSKDKDKSRDEKNDKSKESSKSNTSPKTEDIAQSIHKLGKIPKLSDVKKDKPSISIEVRKPDEPKPKTVKTFHSKFRKHGLEEEVKPPPSRTALLNKKIPAPLPPSIPVPKRPSPAHNETPPDKKPKTQEITEKPGAIKLIPPKPKPMLLLESDMFMDALNASATNKKEPKKRKRRTSGSKDGGAGGDGSPSPTPTPSNATSPSEKSVPPRFYQDTLETDTKEKPSEPEQKDEKEAEEKMDTTEPHTITVNGLKGVLCYHKRKGPKKSIKWKPEPELEEIQYFELDETERVNVTKTFTDMKHLERIHEREAFEKARNLSTDDIMEERTSWRPLIPVDADGQIEVEYGKNSKEKEIQAIRQKGTLQPLYFHKSMIPDSPLEAEPETHPYTEPTIIPLDDVTGNTDNVSDFRNMPWPEPKGNAPPTSSSGNMNMPMFPPTINQFPGGFPPAQFPGMPGFQPPPGIMPADWQNSMAMMAATGMPPPGMPPPGMPPPGMPPSAAMAAALPPGMMVPPDNMMMTPDMFGPPNPMFPVGPDGFNMPQNMFPMDFNMPMPGPQAPPGPDGFSGPGNFRGSNRGGGGRGSGNWRGKNWDNNQRGRSSGSSRGGRKSVCIYFQRKGSCRQGDNCTFLHPGVNCPF